MPPLPRGMCSVCHQPVPVRVNGDAREHNRWSFNTVGHYEICPGSGKPVVKK